MNFCRIWNATENVTAFLKITKFQSVNMHTRAFLSVNYEKYIRKENIYLHKVFLKCVSLYSKMLGDSSQRR